MRLFVAAWPPPDLVDAVRALERPAVPDIRWSTPEQWHITLRFLGETPTPPQTVVELLEQAGLAPAEAVAGPTTACLSPTILCVPVAGLAALATVVSRATADIGAPPDDRSFRGHVTIARARHHASVRGLGLAPVASRWTVDRLDVVASTLRPSGAVYDVVGTVRLSGHGLSDDDRRRHPG